MKNTINREKNIEKEITFENFEKELLSPLKGKLNSFLGGRGDIKIEIYEKESFAFSPENDTIYIPEYWRKGFIENQKNYNEDVTSEYTKEFLIFVLFHESSHYRDMLMELELDGKKSMLSILKRISKEEIDIGENKSIPIGEYIHSLYNCLDDTVVNNEVEASYGGISEDKLIDIYKQIAFPSFEEKEGGSFIEDENGKKIYVGKLKGKFDLILDKSIDYKNLQLSTQMPYALLRGKMVEDQDILLDEKIQNIFFKNNGNLKSFSTKEEQKINRNTIKESIENLKNEMEIFLKENKNNSDKKISERIKNIEPNYLKHIELLEKILEDYKEVENLIFKGVKNSKTNKVNKKSATLIDLLHFFSYSDGFGNDHRLKILPSLRYEIIEKIFEPIQKGLILMDLLTQDLKDGGNESGKGELEESDESEKGERPEEGEKGNKQSHTLHEGDSLEEKIKELESLAENQEIQEKTKKAAKELIDGDKKVQQEIREKYLAKKGIENPKIALEIYDHIISNNTELISSIVSFIKDQLANIEKGVELEEYNTKKGKLDYNKVFKEISKDYTGSNISKSNIYTRKEVIEKLKEDFRSLDFYMLLDISGSVEQFKGKNGMLTIISCVLFNVMKQIEQVIQKETDDYEYKIPVNFLLYGDSDVYSTFGKDLENMETVLDMIDKSIKLSGGTDDSTGWNRIAQYFGDNQLQDEDYINSIKEGKKLPFILQIADSDVSENGVNSIKNKFNNKIGEELSKAIPIKRLILGKKDEEEVTLDQLEKEGHKKGNWDVKEIDGILIRQSVSVHSEKEIEKQLKNIFKNFLLEIFKITKK